MADTQDSEQELETAQRTNQYLDELEKRGPLPEAQSKLLAASLAKEARLLGAVGSVTGKSRTLY
jgi:hypothetical protein